MSRTTLETRTAKRNRHSCNGKYSAKGIEGDVLRTVRQFGSEITRTVKQRAASIRENAADCVTQGRKRARSLERSVQKRVEQRPVASLMAAAGIGLLIGVVFGRRR